MTRKNGLTLLELMIVLLVIAAITATATPLALNAIRRANATNVATGFKTLMNGISNAIFIDESVPVSVNELARNAGQDFGVAWAEGESGYDLVVFTSKYVDIDTLRSMLPGSSEGFPEGEFLFLENALGSSDNSKAYYRAYLGGSVVGRNVRSLLRHTFNGDENPFRYDFGRWFLGENGLSSNVAPWGTGGHHHRGIFDGGDEDMIWENYEIIINLNYSDRYDPDYSSGRGYAIYFRASGDDAGSDLSAYAFQFDPGAGNRFVLNKVSGFNETRIGSTPFPADMPAGENQNHTIRIVVRGSEFQFYFNGARVFSAFDDSLKNGGVGLRTWGNVEVVFRDVVVNEL